MKRIELGGRQGPVHGLLRPFITLEVRDRFGRYRAIRFLVDTGADTSAIPIPLALQHNIAFPRDPSPQLASGLVGAVQQYRGFIHVRMFGEEFDWPCGFLEVPDPTRKSDYAVLGRLGFSLAFDACIEYPYCVVERRRDHLSWWRRFTSRYFTRSRTAPFNQPL